MTAPVPHAWITTPELLGETARPGFHEWTLRVPANPAGLEGHFPNFPVVPAVVQLDWVMDAARTLLGREPVLRGLEDLRFKGLLRPAQVFRLTAELSPSGSTIDFRLWADGRRFSSGRCLLAGTRESP